MATSTKPVKTLKTRMSVWNKRAGQSVRLDLVEHRAAREMAVIVAPSGVSLSTVRVGDPLIEKYLKFMPRWLQLYEYDTEKAMIEMARDARSVKTLEALYSKLTRCDIRV